MQNTKHVTAVAAHHVVCTYSFHYMFQLYSTAANWHVLFNNVMLKKLHELTKREPISTISVTLQVCCFALSNTRGRFVTLDSHSWNHVVV